ncbi:DUF5313 domain-containing protein [Jatrophihabitans telluris]|uniref:DUF5313 domain-containing protein n=1 Tax=Jatrophihabitans telluris TaxID=2038343 RepID=A0ABY4QY00_9ACTN|nr:DUF5313 family protein [Jatrophihabitans telluris]UQX88373.1 DUF5313 domain-containing protein [Jatrophihabitans telluris]
MISEVRRPGVIRWLGYAVGLGLPIRNASWVLLDTTCPTWVARQVVRSLLQMAPIVVVILVFVPGPFWIRGLSALGGLIMGLIFALGYLVETTEHRLVKAGYPAGTGERVRSERSVSGRSEAVARRRERMFARMDRRSH